MSQTRRVLRTLESSPGVAWYSRLLALGALSLCLTSCANKPESEIGSESARAATSTTPVADMMAANSYFYLTDVSASHPGGDLLSAAFDYDLETQGEPEYSVAALAERYLPFLENPFADFALIDLAGPGGMEGIGAERQAESATMGAMLAQETPVPPLAITPPELEGWTPPLGLHGGVARYALITSPDLEAQITALQEANTTSQFVSTLGPWEMGEPSQGGASPSYSIDGFPYQNLPAAVTEENTRLGFFVWIFEHVMLEAAVRSEPGVPPVDLPSLASMFGGINQAAWTNPYAGQPMTPVPMSAPIPGNYSLLPDPEGLLIAFHYLDELGTISSKLVGSRGEVDFEQFHEQAQG